MRLMPPTQLMLAAIVLVMQLTAAAFSAAFKEKLTQQQHYYQQQKRQQQTDKQEKQRNNTTAEKPGDERDVIINGPAEAKPLSDVSLTGAKECRSAFHCWRAEPVFDDGVPVELADRIGKRLVIGELANRRTRGGKCRCKANHCLYYSIADSQYLVCQEF